ncbi:MAG TPA: RDD family protein [Galbitalea sp.]|jgi:uncharacterized RDD family membrane protein YckC|nr:RDD family protein [Galbitalea sp.]
MAAAGASNAIPVDDIEDSVMTGEAVALELRPTPYPLAAAGALIDWLVYFVGGTLLVTFAILIPLSGSTLGDDSATVSAFVSVSIVLILVVIPTAVELLSQGKSLGRLAVGARIVRDDGGPIGFRHAFIRSLVAIFDFYATFGGLAAIVGLTNEKSQRLGDMLAGTYSQYERVPVISEPVFGIPVELQSWASTADVARIPNRLAFRAARFLRQAGQLTPTTRTSVAGQLASELSVWVSPIPTTSPEAFVAAVIALRRERELRAHQLEAERLKPLAATLESLPHNFPKR